MEQSWAQSNNYPAGSPAPSPYQSFFYFSRPISTAQSQIGSWIGSFHPGIVQRSHTGGLALILPFIFGTGISSFLFLSPLVVSPTETLFLLELRYLKQDETFLFHLPNKYLPVMGAHPWCAPPELKLNCPWNLLYVVWFIYTMLCRPWAQL